MAKRRRRRRRRIRILPVIIAALALVVIIAVVIILIKKLSPSRTPADMEQLQKVYHLTSNLDIGRKEAADNEYAIVMEDVIVEDERAFEENGHYYISQPLIKDNVDSRFYYDKNDKVLIVTTALDMIMANLGETGYSVNGNKTDDGYPVVKEADGKIYLEMDFVQQFSKGEYKVYDSPRRVVVRFKTGELNLADTKSGTYVRVSTGIKNPVIADLPKGETVEIIREIPEDKDAGVSGDWYEIASEEGWIGYVEQSDLKNVRQENVERKYDEPEYTSLNIGQKVNMSWLAVYSKVGNDTYDQYIPSTKKLNVISPRWYVLADTEGGIDMLSDKEYVDKAHADGLLVWAMFADEDYEYVQQTLTSTTKRQRVITSLFNDMTNLGIDGINIDFERINSDIGDDFIQFIRELSIICRREGKYLTVDNYAPYDFNACYHIDEQGRLCDYVIIMEYDDYLGTGQAGPNSSLPFIQEVTELSISKVPEQKIIAALPFYSRFWSTDDAGDLSNAPYSMTKAWETVREADASYAWDSALGVDYAEFTLDGEYTQAWIESADSFDAKLTLLSNYNIAGIATWQLGMETADVWDTIAKYY